MLVLHANWTDGCLRIWAESCDRLMRESTDSADASGRWHPFAATASELVALAAVIGLRSPQVHPLHVKLPSERDRLYPVPSPKAAHWSGFRAAGEIRASRNGDGSTTHLLEWVVPALAVEPVEAEFILEAIEERSAAPDSGWDPGANPADPPGLAQHFVGSESLAFFSAAARLVRSLLAEQRVVPALVATSAPARGQQGDAQGEAMWSPFLAEEHTASRVALLLSAMPASARAAVDVHRHDAWEVLYDFLATCADSLCRQALCRENMTEAIEGRDAATDPHVLWLSGLLTSSGGLQAPADRLSAMARSVRRWLNTLEDRGASGAWRLLLRLDEPLDVSDDAASSAVPGGDRLQWRLSFHLQSVESERIIVDAEDIWSLRADRAVVSGRQLENPHQLLLAELARAGRLFEPIERTLREPSPTHVDLNTREAYEFLREIRSLLLDEGMSVEVPQWWDSPGSRLGVRLRLDAPAPTDVAIDGRGPGAPARAVGPNVGLASLVNYRWQFAVGDTPLSLEEFQRLAVQRLPLVRIGGQWVEVRQEDVTAAVRFIRENPGGSVPFAEALRLAFALDTGRTGVPVLGIDAAGWINDLLNAADARMPMLETPPGFKGELRAYQVRGMSWLAFLDKLGLGPVLADDMGLGKTIQLLALLLAERSNGADRAQDADRLAPTLLVVPMSIVGNWVREAARFAPRLRVLVHHGVGRLSGEQFLHAALASDIVLTTYALAHRDRELLEQVGWARVVLDEAQNIKNPNAKQSRAIRSLEAPRRVALTGTPIENRLTELWSIMDFCNPGLLGSIGEFHRTFAVPVERLHDKDKGRRLRSLVRPFILRRLKTDPNVISDLPEKVETREYCRLTPEQATLYESCVSGMLDEVERAEGIRRRGIVLTTLVRLKQICDHPALVLRDSVSSGESAEDPSVADGEPRLESDALLSLPSAARSGKCVRLIEMLDEVVAAGDQALVFTQFRQMGEVLAPMLRHALDREILFLHGGTTQKQRDALVDQFQKADGRSPVFILSLKAGGVGLNLTAASHVFHFDRWWNPAVENQATDRAFRIGQTRRVQVHKFIVSGTLEERIDQMIESKLALAEDVIGSGEDWLTELSTSQLRELLTLRPEALADE